MFNVQLRPEVRKQLKDPDGFASALGIVYAGLTVTMAGVLMNWLTNLSHSALDSSVNLEKFGTLPVI